MPIVAYQIEEVQVLKAGTKIPQFKSMFGNEVAYWTFFFKIGDVMIDTGNSNIGEEIIPHIKDVNVVFITHHHEDHIGNGDKLEKKGAKIYASKKTIPYIQKPPELKMYRMMVWGKPKPFRVEPLENAPLIDYKVEVFETPGHTEDHVSYKIEKYLFTGDLISGKRKPIIAHIDEDYSKIIESIRKILRTKFDIAYTGTGVYYKEEVKAYLEKVLELKEEVMKLWGNGLKEEEIMEKLFPNPPKIVEVMEKVTEGEWSRINLIKSLVR